MHVCTSDHSFTGLQMHGQILTEFRCFFHETASEVYVMY
jgi:hypothetical protein